MSNRGGVDLTPDYLQPGFDPSKLKVAELRAALSREDVEFNPSAKKGELLEVFKKEIEAKASKLRKQYQNVKPSNRGVYEISASETESVDLDVNGDADGELSPAKPKKKGRKKKTLYAPPPPPIPIPIEDELGDGDSTLEVINATKPKKRKSRISAAAFDLDLADDGAAGNSSFSDYNPFQGGGSAPSTPGVDEARKRPRSSSPTKRGRESIATESPVTGSLIPAAFHPKAKETWGREVGGVGLGLENENEVFESVKKRRARMSSPFKKPRSSEVERERLQRQVEDDVRDMEGEIEDAAQIHSPKLDGGIKRKENSFVGTLISALWITSKTIVVLLILVWGGIWGLEKQAVGFCDQSSHTNSLLIQRIQSPHPFISPKLSFVPPITDEWKPFLDPLVPQPTCTFCPPHADCSDGFIRSCNASSPDYVLTSHPLQFGETLPPLPALGIFPSCEPDTERLQKIVDATNLVKSRLRKKRGEVMCSSLSWGTREPSNFAVKMDELMAEVDEDVKNVVKGELELDGDIIVVDLDGSKALASAKEELPWSCWIRQRTLSWTWENKFWLIGMIFLLYQFNSLRNWINRRQSDPPLVQRLYKESLQHIKPPSSPSKIVDTTNLVKSRLRKKRGEVMCSSLSWGTREPSNFAVKLDELMAEVDEDVKNVVKGELELDGDIIVVDLDGSKALASAKEELPWSCWIRQRTLAWTWENKFWLIGMIFLLYQFNSLRNWINRRQSDPPLVQRLYKESLQHIKENSFNNRKDPLHYPYPYIVPINMRDSLLDDYSIHERQRIWKQVEAKVSGNSNVRSVPRAHRGETVKIWEWVGDDSPQLK
ncbi:hypothetical protein BT69DRAFT_1334837 [Atractiella rhizophila]|nr:hypothetical protein BT69DRAFT_1334837 [Atractiella rhizophila]